MSNYRKQPTRAKNGGKDFLKEGNRVEVTVREGCKIKVGGGGENVKKKTSFARRESDQGGKNSIKKR